MTAHNTKQHKQKKRLVALIASLAVSNMSHTSNSKQMLDGTEVCYNSKNRADKR